MTGLTNEDLQEIVLELLGRVKRVEKGLNALSQKVKELEEAWDEGAAEAVKTDEGIGVKMDEGIGIEDTIIEPMDMDLNDDSSSSEEEEAHDSHRPGTRGEALEKAMQSLMEHNENVTVRRGNRAEGAGIVIEIGAMVFYAKFYYSRTYPGFNWMSWSGVLEEDVDRFNYFLFAINDSRTGLYYLFFSQEQMVELVKDREPDNNGKYHLSFMREIDGRVYEIRGDKPVDVTYALNNFTIEDPGLPEGLGLEDLDPSDLLPEE